MAKQQDADIKPLPRDESPSPQPGNQPSQQATVESTEDGEGFSDDDQAQRRNSAASSSSWYTALSNDEEDDFFNINILSSPGIKGLSPESPAGPSPLPAGAHPALVARYVGRLYIVDFKTLKEESNEHDELQEIVKTIESEGLIAAFDKIYAKCEPSGGLGLGDSALTLAEFVAWWGTNVELMKDAAHMLADSPVARDAAQETEGFGAVVAQEHKQDETHILASHATAQDVAAVAEGSDAAAAPDVEHA